MVDYLFRWPDYLVFGAVLVISVSIGIYHACAGGKQKTTAEYFMGNRKLSIIPTGLSILVSYQSSITFVGIPADVYKNGMSFILWYIGLAIGMIITTLVLVPLLYPLKVVSCFEYLGRRYHGKLARTMGSILCMISMVLYSGVVIYAPSTAMEAVSDIPVWLTIIIIGVLATIYTAIGGMKAVIWTDVFQCVIMLIGIWALFIQGIVVQGGFSKIWQNSYEGGRSFMGSFSFDPRVRHSGWDLIIGSIPLSLATGGIGQANVQRFSSVPTMRGAQFSVLLVIPGLLIFGTCAVLIGLIMYSYNVERGCDLLASGQAKNSNQLVVMFMTEVFRFMPGIAGLFLASVCSASLSSVSSAINGLAALTWEDLFKANCAKISPRHTAMLVKCFVIFYGGLSTAVAFLAMAMGGPVIQIALVFLGASTGPLLGMFILGAFSRKSNGIGASIGAACGFCFAMWVGIGSYTVPAWPSLPPGPTTNCTDQSNATVLAYVINVTSADQFNIIQTLTTQPTVTRPYSAVEPLYRLSYLWLTSIGMLTAIIIGIIVSLLTGCNKPQEVPEELLVSPLEKIKSIVPLAIQKWFSCKKTSRRSGQYSSDHHNSETFKYTEHNIITPMISGIQNGANSRNLEFVSRL